MHDGDQVDEDAEVVLGQPLEVVGPVGGDHLLVRGPALRRDRLYRLLQLLQHSLDRFYLTDHQVITHLGKRSIIRNTQRASFKLELTCNTRKNICRYSFCCLATVSF